jgi:CSLREA domain-containing protein
MRVSQDSGRLHTWRRAAALTRMALLVALVAFWLLAAPLAPGVQAATFTVNVLTDASDLGDTNGNGAFDAGEIANGTCDTDAGTSGNQCSLRAAVFETNGNGDTADTITFGSLSGTITIGSTLPVGDSDTSVAGADGLANSTTIDGNSSVTVNGGMGFACFKVTSASNTIRDLSITDCTQAVLITGESADANAVRGNTLYSNLLGVDIEEGADDNTVGGTSTADRNIIRNNALYGVFIGGAGTTGNVIAGNCIGTLANCSTAAPNGHDGVAIDDTTSDNTVGGTAAGVGNVIAFSGDDGVEIAGGTNQVVTRNVMFLNTGLGIRSPVAPPVLTGCADAGGGNVACTGMAGGAGYVVEVYRANVDASGPEGDLFLCSAVSGGGGAWGCTFPNPGGGSATATQRDPGGANSTSSFAAAVGIPPTSGVTYTVNSTGDDPDDNIGDGVCHTAGGQCTLRAAIEEANTSVDDDVIAIGVAGPIVLLGGLPTITDDDLIITGSDQQVSLTAPGIAFDINADRVHISNLIIDGEGVGTLGIQISTTTDDLVLDGFTVRGFTDDGFDNSGGGGGKRNTIQNSTFTGNAGVGIDFNGGQDDIIRDNVITNNGDNIVDDGLEVSNEDNFLIQGNTFSGNFNAQIDIAGMLAGQHLSIIQNTITSGSDGIVIDVAVNATAAIDIGLSVPNRNVFRGTIAAPAEQHLRNLSPANINAIYNDWDAYSPAAIEGVICHDGDPGCGPGIVDFDPFIDTPSPFPGGLAALGGIAALPSAAPAIPGIADQDIPAIIGSGQPAIVAVFCDDGTAGLPFDASECADPISFTLTRSYPQGGAPLATFAATGTDSLVVSDNASADMDAAVGVIAVEVDAGWGSNEIVEVYASDHTGDMRATNIVIVDTILVWGPTGPTVGPDGFAFVSYRCDDIGRLPIANPSAQFAETELADADNSQGLDDMYDGLFGPFNGVGDGWGSNTMVGDADFMDSWCGGDTSSLSDDFVDFQTDKGIFSVDPTVSQQQMAGDLAAAVGYFYPPSLDFDCGEGQTIDTFDIDALAPWGEFLLGWPPGGEVEGGCDVDGWRNSVVTTQILPSGEVGVATVTAQQGGGGPLRTVNVTFVGSAASLFIDGPGEVRLEGADFTAIVVDQDGRPVGGEDVECSVSPTDGPFAVLPDSATTGPDGIAAFSLIPTGASYPPGQELVITCWLAQDPSVFATETILFIGPCGDANVDAVDALFVLQYVVGLRPGDNACVPGSGTVCLLNSGVDCDADVDAVDALFILQFVVYLRPELCACPLP